MSHQLFITSKGTFVLIFNGGQGIHDEISDYIGLPGFQNQRNTAAANNGTMKLNLGLDELDDLFSLRGHLESLTAYFTQAPPAIMNGNEASTSQALLRSIQDPMWSKGNQIPVMVATKRLREYLQPQWSAKGFKYEPISPVKSELYELSEEEVGAFFHPM
ncbi:unnamed protein product [Mytilus coruscus]|uniref:Uncharacterized protein n=1 Tax=Mytilus coruscus TaxID=42192 RepID=A0A6J8AMD2_MYTCO|nr:unnamed protein product [Mytilus coruscus]